MTVAPKYFYISFLEGEKEEESKPKPYYHVILPDRLLKTKKIFIFNYQGLNIKSLLLVGVGINTPVKYE